jgi:hypothetical protein
MNPYLCLQAVVLQQALHQIPSPTQEVVIRNLSARLAMQLLNVGAAYMPNQVRTKLTSSFQHFGTNYRIYSRIRKNISKNLTKIVIFLTCQISCKWSLTHKYKGKSHFYKGTL